MKHVDITNIASNVVYNKDGYWDTNNNASISYPSEGNSLTFAVEDSSFWFKHRNEVISSILKTYPPDEPFFDIGGGNGYVAKMVEDSGIPTVLVEPGVHGVKNAVHRGLENIVCAEFNSLHFDSYKLPSVGIFDVLEHINDDVLFLKNLRDVLNKKGRIYITVPTYPALWSNEDVYAGHFRRYTKKSLSDCLNKAGFDIEYISYFFSFLPAPIFLSRTIPSFLKFRVNVSLKSAQQDHSSTRGFASPFIEHVMKSEIQRLNNFGTIKLGSSCIAVARLK